MSIGSSVQVQHMSLTKHNKETYITFNFVIFAELEMARKLFDTVVEYTTCKYLGHYLNGKHNRHITWYLSLKEKKIMSSYF